MTLKAVSQPTVAARDLLVKVTGSYDGGAVYSGTVWEPASDDIDPTVSATESTIGTAGEDVIIINLVELGFSTHDLTDGGQTVTIFPATWHPATSTIGLPVALIWGLDTEDCT
jgi:hypothetical protein